MSKIKKDKIGSAYHASKNVYDNILTQKTLFARFYIKFFWGGTDDEAITQKMLSFVPDDFAGEILDVPCGTAVFTAEKWSRLANAKITCIDYSVDMLEQARQRLGNCRHINIVQGDVGALPIDNQAVDIVMSMNGFHAFPDKMKAFDETCRVLKPGGKFIACFYIRGKLRRLDLLAKLVLAPKGWFTPPFHTEDEVRQILHERYSKVEIHTDNAILWCVCEK